MSDVLIYAFESFLAKGMSHAEALAEFNKDEWNAAMLAEMDNYGTKGMLDLAAKAGREESNAHDMEQATVLWLENWISELPDPRYEYDVMSWYWRRPSRREGKPGRKFLSTSQAYNALRREKRDAFIKGALERAKDAGGVISLKYVYTFCGMNFGYCDQSHAEIVPPLHCEEVVSAGLIGIRLDPTPIVKLQREGSTTLKVGWQPADLERLTKALGFPAAMAD